MVSNQLSTRSYSSNEYRYFHTECALCGLLREETGGDESKQFQFCGKCRVVVYCSRDHQVSHWKMHKRFCKENEWKRDDPTVVVASATCSYLSCRCKGWIPAEDGGSAGASSTDFLEVRHPSSSTYSNVPTTNTCGESPINGSQSNVSGQDHSSLRLLPIDSSDVFRLHVDVKNSGPEMPDGTIHNLTGSRGSNYCHYNTSETSIVSRSVPSSSTSFGEIATGSKDALSQVHDFYEEQSTPNSLPRKTPLKGGQTIRNQRAPVDKRTNGNTSNTSVLRPQILQQPHPPQEDLENHAPAATFATATSEVFSVHANSQFLESSYQQHLPNSFQSQGSSSLQSDQSTRSSNASHILTGSTAEDASSGGPSALNENTSSGGGAIKDNDSIDSNLHDSVCKNVNEGVRPSMTSSSATIPFQHRNNMQPISGQTIQETRLWMLQVWQQVIEDMNRYGVCVVDNLLGDARGNAVLREVQSMYSSGAFQDGQLVKGKDNSQSKSIRGDKITWVDGREPNCKNIAVLIKLLDNIVMGANTVSNNGKLGSYRIKERSKAMVACYPGSGTHYVKHVDNPNDDGRCVTAIYYLNKDWDTSENGGLLRIFPEGWSHQVADIEPLFDRVIFFWSDRRNPHEVQPAFKTRYAITLWYFDSNAKERARINESNKLPNLQPVS